MQPDCLNLWYFELILLDLPEFIVWNIKGLQKDIEFKKLEFTHDGPHIIKLNASILLAISKLFFSKGYDHCS